MNPESPWSIRQFPPPSSFHETQGALHRTNRHPFVVLLVLVEALTDDFEVEQDIGEDYRSP